ncbi:MAG TPA: helix-turn-helix domain-containing protein [Methylomirabilota bacterium]|nr:helix-turn-helix domain-containing protein [Methylomirabilota bacterium]
MGTILASLHEEHKARRLRIKRAALKSLTDNSSLAGQGPEIEITEQVPPEKNKKNHSSFDIVLNEICRYYNVRQIDLLSSRRLNNISGPRHMLAYMMYHMTSLTTHQIAPRMNRDPSTIGYAIKKIQDNLERHQSDIDALEATLKDLLLSHRKFILGLET